MIHPRGYTLPLGGVMHNKCDRREGHRMHARCDHLDPSAGHAMHASSNVGAASAAANPSTSYGRGLAWIRKLHHARVPSAEGRVG
jgi:hypothetical protein